MRIFLIGFFGWILGNLVVLVVTFFAEPLKRKLLSNRINKEQKKFFAKLKS